VNKSIWTILAVVVILMFVLIMKKGIEQPEEDFNHTVLINYCGGTGCCQVAADSCASGDAVNEESCAELKGTFDVNEICNTQTGQCE